MSDDHTAGALLVGAGNIGALYDIDSGSETVPPTHLSALATVNRSDGSMWWRQTRHVSNA